MVFAPTARRGRLVLTLGSCLALVVVPACTSDSSPDESEAQAPATRTVTMVPDEPSPAPSDEEPPGPRSTAVCLGERPYNPDSAPYAGEGPHPMTIVHPAPGYGVLELRYVTLPDGWDPEVDADPTDEAADHDEVQLVVCDSPVATGGVMGTCTFSHPGMSGTMNVVQADHVFVVREARTGRHVAGFRMLGTAGAQESCPSLAMDSGGAQVAQAADDDAVAAKLRSLYEGAVSKP